MSPAQEITREGMTIRQCAEALGVSRATVLNDERRALRKLRLALQRRGYTADIIVSLLRSL